jgi:hypothetical protein
MACNADHEHSSHVAADDALNVSCLLIFDLAYEVRTPEPCICFVAVVYRRRLTTPAKPGTFFARLPGTGASLAAVRRPTLPRRDHVSACKKEEPPKGRDSGLSSLWGAAMPVLRAEELVEDRHAWLHAPMSFAVSSRCAIDNFGRYTALIWSRVAAAPPTPSQR